MLEAMMIICFGISWPFSIYKTVKIKKVTGKSLLFLWFVFIGYVSGIMHKLLYAYDWVIMFYIVNAIMVLLDIIVYYKYRD